MREKKFGDQRAFSKETRTLDEWLVESATNNHD
jgi:hypothetical protein